MNISAPTVRTFIKFDISLYISFFVFEIRREKIQVALKFDKNAS
jgi:hypothetical protein